MDLRPSCGQCKCAMDMANIRANPDGSGFVCRTCLEGDSGKSSLSSSSTVKSKEIFEKKSYLCEDCSYTFERNATFYVADCPMCAKENVHEMVTDSDACANEPTQEQDWLYQ